MVELQNPLIFQHLWVAVAILLAIFVGASLIGHHIGKRNAVVTRDTLKPPLQIFPTSMLGLMALLLGFSFSMAVTRYEERRSLVIQEANAVGTTALRAEMLAEPFRSESLNILDHYVDTRLDFYFAGTDPRRISAAVAESRRLGRELWKIAMAAAKVDPSPITALYVTSLNQSLDLENDRVAALENRVPKEVSAFLILVGIIALSAVGYVQGHKRAKNNFQMIALSMILALAIGLIQDLDRPRSGFIGISQNAMERLKASRPLSDSSGHRSDDQGP